MTPFLQDADVTLYHGDVLAVLRELPAESVDCCVTSPPYWGLRDYGQEGQLGLEPTPEEYVTRMVEVFREVRRVLAAHGTVWLNLGDSYAARLRQAGDEHAGSLSKSGRGVITDGAKPLPIGLKEKDLVGIPWRVAFALQADGWYLRSDIVWAKPNPMPESVTDRPTKAHEYVFLLSKQPRYFFDQEAVREANTPDMIRRSENGYTRGVGSRDESRGDRFSHAGTREILATGRNIRSVWEIATQPYPEAHFATFPEELARRCIAAGCPEQVCRVCGKARERVVERERPNIEVPMTPREQAQREEAKRLYERKELIGPSNNQKSRGLSEIWTNAKATKVVGESWTECTCKEWGQQQALDRLRAVSSDPALAAPATKYRPGTVLDPFMGSGTVAHVARKLGRHSVGIDLNESYLKLAARRLQQQSLFAMHP